MKKILYSGREEGLFVFGTFIHYMNEGGPEGAFFEEIAGFGRRDGSVFYGGCWKDREDIEVDYLIKKDSKEPVTVIGTGREEDLDNLEKLLMQEQEARMTTKEKNSQLPIPKYKQTYIDACFGK